MLARLGAERQPEPDPAPDPAREDLRALGQRRDQLKRMEVQEKNRRAACPLEAVAAGIGEMLAILAAHIERIDKAIAEHVSRHPGLKSADRLLRSIPGFGAVAAVTMLAHMPELGTVSRRAAASLGGLAPRARDSGRHRGRRFIGDGRRHVRRVLFMAAMSFITPRLPRGLHCAQEGRGEAGEAHSHRRGATAPDHRQRRPPDGHPLPAKHPPGDLIPTPTSTVARQARADYQPTVLPDTPRPPRSRAPADEPARGSASPRAGSPVCRQRAI